MKSLLNDEEDDELNQCLEQTRYEKKSYFIRPQKKSIIFSYEPKRIDYRF